MSLLMYGCGFQLLERLPLIGTNLRARLAIGRP